MSNLVTKVNSNYKENSMVEYNLYLMKINNGKMQNFMQPIGLGKEQKRKNERIKNIMIKLYDNNSSSVSKSGDYQQTLTCNDSDSSLFNNVKLFLKIKFFRKIQILNREEIAHRIILLLLKKI